MGSLDVRWYSGLRLPLQQLDGVFSFGCFYGGFGGVFEGLLGVFEGVFSGVYGVLRVFWRGRRRCTALSV